MAAPLPSGPATCRGGVVLSAVAYQEFCPDDQDPARTSRTVATVVLVALPCGFHSLADATTDSVVTTHLNRNPCSRTFALGSPWRNSGVSSSSRRSGRMQA